MRNFGLSFLILLTLDGFGQSAEKYLKSFLEKLDAYHEFNVTYSSYQDSVFMDKGTIQKFSDDHFVMLRSNGIAIQEKGLQLNVLEEEMTIILKRATEGEMNPLSVFKHSANKLKVSFLECSEKDDLILIRLEHQELQGYAMIKIDSKNDTLIEIELHTKIDAKDTVITTKYHGWSFEKGDEITNIFCINRYLDNINGEYLPTSLVSGYDFINLIN